MSAAVVQSFAFSRRSLLGVLHLLLAYWDAPSRRKYVLCGTDSRAFASEQADSIASTNICNTWLCRHVYRPCARAYLQLDKTCRIVWTSPQSTHLESSTIPHFRRLSREGSWSYRDLITKDSRSGGMLHMSLHEIGLCRASSHVVHCPCWPSCTAFVILAFSISLFLSWMINADLWAALACVHPMEWLQPIPWRPTWMGPRISSKVRTSIDFSISSWALNFLPDLSSGLDPQFYCTVCGVVDH